MVISWDTYKDSVIEGFAMIKAAGSKSRIVSSYWVTSLLDVAQSSGTDSSPVLFPTKMSGWLATRG